MKLLIDIPEDSYERVMNPDKFYRDIDGEKIRWAVYKGIPIPDNATNGDMIKTLFSNTFDNFCERTTWEWNRWWNAPYQKGGKE